MFVLFYWFVGLGPSGSGRLVLLSIGCYLNTSMTTCMCCTVAAAAGCQIASHGQMKLKFLDDNRQERVVEVIRFKIWNYWSSIVAVVTV